MYRKANNSSSCLQKLKTMNYKELQNALKNLRSNGSDVQVKLNAKLEVLQAEYDRLTTDPETLTTVEPITADEFNEVASFPTGDAEYVSIAYETYEAHAVELAQEVAASEGLTEVSSSLETIQTETLAPSYWIDGSELSEHLESTQVQAIRNLQDGWRSLKQLGRNLQSFKKGFDEGLIQLEATRAAKANERVLKPFRMAEKVIELPIARKRLRAA